MRIAIATEGNRVSPHFGRCALYTVVEMNAGKVAGTELVENPGHRPNYLPEFLHVHQIDCVVSGGMGSRARQLFHQYDIETVVGVDDKIDTVIQQLESGALSNGQNLCHPNHEKSDHKHEHCHGSV